MVARRPQEGLGVSRSALVVSRLPRAAYQCAPAASDRSPGSRACRHHQAGRRSYAAALQLARTRMLPAVAGKQPGLTGRHPALLARDAPPFMQYLKQDGRENDVSIFLAFAL